jgi:transcriptional repressor NF-X1
MSSIARLTVAINYVSATNHVHMNVYCKLDILYVYYICMIDLCIYYVRPCHPGPCPPCSLMGPVITCYCGQNARQGRCVDTDYSTKGYSCEEVCGELLGCGKHRCKENCHSGLCTPCEVEEIQSCYCGRHERTARCGNGKQIQLRGHIGYYSCGEECDM